MKKCFFIIIIIDLFSFFSMKSYQGSKNSMEYISHPLVGSKLSLGSSEVDNRIQPFHYDQYKNIRERGKSEVVTNF